MIRGLGRLLHLRKLMEEVASLDLQKRTADLRRLEEQAGEHRNRSIEARGKAIAQLLEVASTDSMVGLADAEIFSWKQQRLEVAAQTIRAEVLGLRELRTARRIERRQAEILVAEAEQLEKQEQSRRGQQHLDDWYQSLPSSSPGPE